MARPLIICVTTMSPSLQGESKPPERGEKLHLALTIWGLVRTLLTICRVVAAAVI